MRVLGDDVLELLLETDFLGLPGDDLSAFSLSLFDRLVVLLNIPGLPIGPCIRLLYPLLSGIYDSVMCL